MIPSRLQGAKNLDAVLTHVGQDIPHLFLFATESTVGGKTTPYILAAFNPGFGSVDKCPMLFNVSQNTRFLPTDKGISIEDVDDRLHFGDADLVISKDLSMLLTDFRGFERHRSLFTARGGQNEVFNLHAL